MPIDMQSAIIAELITRLAVVLGFGGLVFEDDVLRLIDAEDDTLPEDMIVIQSGSTEEVERQSPGSVRERVALNITAITRRRNPAPLLRAARLAIKQSLPGTKAGLALQGVQLAAFQTEMPYPPEKGGRWSFHVLPLQITYVQALK